MFIVRCCVVRGLTTASVCVRMYACWQVWGKHWQYHTEKKFKYTHKKYWKYVETQPNHPLPTTPPSHACGCAGVVVCAEPLAQSSLMASFPRTRCGLLSLASPFIHSPTRL